MNEPDQEKFDSTLDAFENKWSTLYPEFNNYFHTYYSTRASTYNIYTYFGFIPLYTFYTLIQDCGPNVFVNFNMVIQTPTCFWKGKK